MKPAFSLIIVYIIACILGVTCAAVIYMLYHGCTLLVAGNYSSIISASVFVTGIRYAFPASFLLCSMFLTLYLIRRPTKKLVSFIVYLILGAATWGFFFPYALKTCYEKWPLEKISVQERKQISPGYFRKEGQSVYFFSNVTDNKASGLRIPLESYTSGKSGIEYFSNLSLNTDQNKSFSDSLFKNSVTIPFFISKGVEMYEVIINAGYTAVCAGYYQWLTYASIGIALFSVFALAYCSVWRLINSFMVIFSSVGICLLNAIYYETSYFDKLKVFFNHFSVYSIHMVDLCMLLINSLIALFFITIGVIMHSIHRRARRVERDT